MIQETWIQANWRPTAAFVYLFICLIDFVVMPLLTFFVHKPFFTIMDEINHFQPEVQKAILTQVLTYWTPITIAGNGIFHIAFGGILGVAAWGRTSEKNQIVKQLGESGALADTTVPDTTIDTSTNATPSVSATTEMKTARTFRKIK